MRFIAVLCNELRPYSRSNRRKGHLTTEDIARSRVAIEATSHAEARGIVKALIASPNVVVVAAVEGYDDTIPMLVGMR